MIAKQQQRLAIMDSMTEQVHEKQQLAKQQQRLAIIKAIRSGKTQTQTAKALGITEWAPKKHFELESKAGRASWTELTEAHSPNKAKRKGK
jgi:hypothetical protein